jgi:hypothetical protein
MGQHRADFERLLEVLRTQPSQRHARDIFWNSDALFLRMTQREREVAYAEVDRILEELPATD